MHIAISVALLASFASAASPASIACSQPEILAGLCSITPSTTDTAVVLDGAIPGSGSSDTGNWDDALGSADDDSSATQCVSGPVQPERCFGTAPRPIDPAVPAPVVTLADVATFAPTLAPAVSEPGGWAIIGLPVNLVGPAGSVTVDGVLLGNPAQVRFTPIAWHWAYGDGSASVVTTPGASWAALGIPEFAATATSHVYAAPGIYRVSLEVDMVADYRIGGGPWLAVPGLLTIPVSEFDLLVATADTVLVDRDCLASPAGPGC